MKTLKLAMVAAILSIAMISYAGTKPGPVAKTKVVKISLTQALHEPGLVIAMRAQLKISFLKVEPHGLYVGTVYYNKLVYKIYGTRTAWVRFFLSKSKTIVGTNVFHQ
ncbi:MAG: hypothetical protein ABFS05_01700 [Bacteroidota bacterium]